MNQTERRLYLIRELLREDGRYNHLTPETMSAQEQKNLLRSLMNIRMPAPLTEEYLAAEQAYLREEAAAKGIVSLSSLSPVEKNLYLWQGDITRLQCDAIVNAANSQMLGCFVPLHNCIDNAIPYLITHRHTTSFKASA